MSNVTILIADDHPLFRTGLRALIGGVPGTEVVGEAGSGAEAIRLTEALQPDLVLMDLKMPDGGGLEAIRTIVRTSPHVRVLVVTMFEDDDSVFAAMRAGARGYVLKDSGDAEMARAILAVGSGESIFSPALAARMIRFFSDRPSLPPDLFPELTPSERNVLRLVAQGMNNDEIARALVLSPKSVRNYVSNVFSKLQVADRAQAIVLARRAGFE